MRQSETALTNITFAQKRSGVRGTHVRSGVLREFFRQVRDRFNAQAVLFDMKTEECEMVEEAIDNLQRMSSSAAVGMNASVGAAGTRADTFSDLRRARNRVKNTDKADDLPADTTTEANDIEDDVESIS